MTTQAEARAGKYADKLRAAGWTVEVTVEHHDAEHYPNGDGVMLDGRTWVWVTAARRWFDGRYNFGFMTWDGQGGHRKTTRYGGGTYTPALGKRRELRGYATLNAWVSVAVTDFTEPRASTGT